MENKFKVRLYIFLAIIAALMIALVVQTGILTLGEGASLLSESANKTTKTQYVDGNRGSILDANGVPLAYDDNSYNVEFLRNPTRTTYTDRAYYTDIIINTIDIIEENGGEIIDTFNIVRDEEGNYSFYFGDVSNLVYEKRLASWQSNMYVSDVSDPETVYRDLRNRYRIPENMSYEDARKLLSIWQEVQLSSYIAYEPVTIAENVSINTVATIESMTDALDGMQIAASSTRKYPYKSIAANVIGYIGKINDEETYNELKDKGYSPDDSIGIIGVESSMEEYLTGNTTERQGTRTVEVSSSGEVISEIDSTPATRGYDVMTTIDLELQVTAEKALEDNVKYIQEQQQIAYDEKREEYDEILNGRELNFAKSGAAVVMDVHTGSVLALASYPSYDLNLFTGGISYENYQKLLQDPATPLFNKAISSTGIPGSIFKLCTAVAGLMEGKLTVTEEISDEGYFDKYINDPDSGEHGPKCWIFPYYDEHQNLNLQSALQVSCNYYFYVVADRLGIDSLDKWAENLGLSTKTNIAIPGEAEGQVGGPTVLYNPDVPLNQQKTALPVIVYNSIKKYLVQIGENRNVEYTEVVLDKTARELVDLAKNGSTQNGEGIRQILYEDMGVPTEVSYKMGYDNEINNYISELVWKPTDTAIVGIGAGITAVTPIAVARYVSAIVNGGTVYDARLIDRIINPDGEVEKEFEPVVANQLDINEEYLDAIMKGMKSVISPEDSVGLDTFANWKYGDIIGGKTGTGVVSENIPMEDNAWFVSFAPYDDPEIAVVIYIPNGYKGAYASRAAKDILEYYLDRKYADDAVYVQDSNSLVTKYDLTEAEETDSAQSTGEDSEV